ncbi:hypothetical protein JM93_02739 [Roseibium hamelinense]|uniref:Uncharacterized protein n=1 Tax=Roseibium hamelinense TaxID=150831 RepID=A0A562SXN4_9HYPH|nr:hypothetical protein JM93_02739 [Roseibium hamelinense]
MSLQNVDARPAIGRHILAPRPVFLTLAFSGASALEWGPAQNAGRSSVFVFRRSIVGLKSRLDQDSNHQRLAARAPSFSQLAAS